MRLPGKLYRARTYTNSIPKSDDSIAAIAAEASLTRWDTSKDIGDALRLHPRQHRE
jgi:hypothetical protein